MNKTGYDGFFKAAKKAKQQAPPTKTAIENRLRQNVRLKKSRAKPFPVLSVVAGFLLIGLGLIYLAKPDLVEKVLGNIDVRFMGQLAAQEKPAVKPENPAASTSPVAAKDAGAVASDKKNERLKKDESGSEDLSYIEKLRVRKEELDLREKELNQLEEELQRQKVEVDSRIRQLDQMRRDIASRLKERVDSDETQVNKLVDLYSSMKPKQAADVIANLHEDLAVQVLGKMKKKNAAEVMNLLPSDKARGLSEKLTGYKR